MHVNTLPMRERQQSGLRKAVVVLLFTRQPSSPAPVLLSVFSHERCLQVCEAESRSDAAAHLNPIERLRRLQAAHLRETRNLCDIFFRSCPPTLVTHHWFVEKVGALIQLLNRYHQTNLRNIY